MRLYALPALLAVVMIFPKLWQGHFNVDTGWYSAISLQSWRAALGGEGLDLSSLWSLSGYGGEPYLNKPPLAFWIHGLSLWLLGPTLLAARLPTAVAAIGCVLLTVHAVRAASGRRTAILTGVILALTLEFTRHARAFSLDMWQLLFFCAAIDAAVHAVARRDGRLLALAGLPLGLALMVKPLVGFIALGMLAAWVVATGRRRWLGWTAAAGLLAAAVAAPWHLSMAAIHGDAFTAGYFGREIMERAAGVLGDANDDAGNPFYYLRELLRQYWPWVLTAAVALAAWVRHTFVRRASGPGTDERPRSGVGGWRTDGVTLAVIWSIAWLVLLSSFADKRPRYLLPVYPAWAWLSAVWLLTDAPRWAQHARRAMERWSLPVVGVAAVVISLAPIRIERERNEHFLRAVELLRAEGTTEIWEGGLPTTGRGARFYLELGEWPLRTRDRHGTQIASPGPGALVMYERRDGWAPGPDETVLLVHGPLTISRVGPNGWRPVRIAE